MASASTVPTGPQDIPASSVATPPPPPLDHSTWSSSPESPGDLLATPQTPNVLQGYEPQQAGKRRLTYGFDAAPPPDLPESSSATDARRRSSTPFIFEIGETVEQPAPGPVDVNPSPEPSTGLSKVVRRHLERSKTSFRRLRASSDATDTSADTTPRFKALRRLRAQSLSSSSSSAAATPFGSSAQLSTLGMSNDDESGIMPGRRSSGKSVIQTAKERMRRRSVPISPAFNVVLTSAGVHGPSPPQPSDEIVWGTLSYRAPPVEPVKIDYFGTMLPRELKIAVFRALLGMGSDGDGRWDGENGARRELVRLSRVSKEWRSLCFDGELWQSPDFTPLASVLPAETLRSILEHARPCIKTLKLNDLECLPGQAVTGILNASSNAEFSSLTTLDLRGCHTIQECDIINLLTMSPNLKILNLKGSRVVTGATLYTLKKRVHALEELDVSRCMNLRFQDIEYALAYWTEHQRTALRSLRIAGLPNASGGHLLYHLAKLPNLKRLDLLGCSWLSMADIQDFVRGLNGPSPLTHLIISGCTGLSVSSFELLINRLPAMEIFEAANLDTVFYLDPPPVLALLVRSMPLLRRLDLDSTGRYGGVDDRLLHELIPGAIPNSELAESHLEQLRIGNAKFVTPAAMRKVIRELPKLQVLIANGTEADNSVMRDFVSRHPRGEICLIDCHRLTPDACIKLGQSTRPRNGWGGYLSLPFGYTDTERLDRVVLHTFWGWDRVIVPPAWREARDAGEKPEEVERRGSASWWRPGTPDDIDMDRACHIM